MTDKPQNQCDAEKLDALLRGTLSNEDAAAVETHLSHCRSCAERIQLAAVPETSWNETQSMLSLDEFDGLSSLAAASSLFPSDPADPVDSPTKELLTREISGWLDPTDDPAMLGRFAGYEIVGIIGHGGMGIVLKGFETSLNRYVAIKLLAPRLATNATARRRFAREAQAAAAVRHDSVIAIHRVDEWHGLPFLTMPYVGGVSLQKRIDTEGPLSIEETLRVGVQIASGLAAAHSQGLVHRDIKPANILLEQGVERVTITDFGLARAADDASVTRTGVIAGTPQYMSPEQAQAKSIDDRSDLFSLGSVLYVMATGRAPFRGEGSFNVLTKIIHEPARGMREIEPTIPQWFEQLVHQLHAKFPAQRFQSAEEVAELLENCLAHVQHPTATPLPESARKLSPNQRRRPPIGKFIAAAAFAFSLIFAGVLIVLEMNKGTLSIVSEANVPIRIMQGDEIVQRLTVTRSGKSVRVAAGKYIVVVEGEPDGIEVKDGIVSLRRGDTETVRIVRSQGSLYAPVATGSMADYADKVGVFGALPTEKGTLSIESEATVPIRIMQGGETVQSLTVTRSGESVRVVAGKYRVVIDGEPDGIEVKGGSVALRRGDTETVRIVRSHDSINAPDAADSMAVYTDNAGVSGEYQTEKRIIEPKRPRSDKISPSASGSKLTVTVRNTAKEQRISHAYLTLWRALEPGQNAPVNTVNGSRGFGYYDPVVWKDDQHNARWIRVGSAHPNDGRHSKDGVESFHFKSLSPGRYRVTAMSYNRDDTTPDPTPYGVSEQVTMDGMAPATIDIKPVRGSADLRIRVVDTETRKPIEHLRLRLRTHSGIPIVHGHGSGNFFEQTNDLGKVRFAQLPPGDFVVEILGRQAQVNRFVEYHQLNEPVRIQVNPGQQQIDIAVQPRRLPQTEIDKRFPFSAFGRVTDSEGNPVADVKVRVATGRGTLRVGGQTKTDAEGKYRLYFRPGMTAQFSEHAPQGVGVQAAQVYVDKPGWEMDAPDGYLSYLMSDGTKSWFNEMLEGKGVKVWGKSSAEEVIFVNQPREINIELKPDSTNESKNKL